MQRSLTPAVLTALIALYLIWGSTYFAMRLVVEGMPPLLSAGIRYTIAGGLMFLFLKWRGAAWPTAVQWRDAGIVGVLLLLGGNGAVALALDHAHRQQVVHRDIKPANVMYDPSTQSVKVTDFGIARITGSSKTKTGMVLGTPSFMSPEQLAGLHVDGRSDLYSLGVMLFQLLTGSLPLKGDSMAALMYQIANQPAPSVRSLRPELPQALADVLDRTLAKSPGDRYQTGAELAAQLRRCIDPGDDAAAPPSTPAQGDEDRFEATHAFPQASENAMAATLVTPRPGSARGS